MKGLLASALLLGSMVNAQALCIRSADIDSTSRPDDNTIVFAMRDKSVYRNDLPVRCFGLKQTVYGFTYQPTDPSTDELCDGMFVVRMNDLGHASCIAGNFTRAK